MTAMFLAYMPPRSIYDGTRLNNIQGKVAELRLELNSGGKKDKNYAGKKIALKKIVANMTMSNNDMVALFPDIIGCMGIQSLEIKKMCFLFLVNYARMRPEIAVKAIPVLEHVSSKYSNGGGSG
ncbi:hypothetical protein NW766_005432 [Fusarium irregulare]|uniref:Uncharacterized protein n=1 Tax=Fusarium irregulare TaxID=2494466 RepID=A0A9W8PRC5_9HYPO|nr:hypothetical protein NW766_005432 [Fusarium irregulare]